MIDHIDGKVLAVLEDLASAPFQRMHLPAGFRDVVPGGLLDESLVLGSIRWRKYLGRPKTKHMYEAFNVEIYRLTKFYPGSPGDGGPHEVTGRVPTDVRVWDGADDDAYHRVCFLGHRAQGGKPNYFVDVEFRRGVHWTPPPEVIATQGQYRVISPATLGFKFPGPVLLEPFVITYEFPQLPL